MMQAENRPVCSFCDTSPAVMSCSGSNPHHFCDDCINSYARTSFKASGGCFSKELVSDEAISHVGELPCPLFANGQCTCHSMEVKRLARCLSDELLALWHQAIGRNAVSFADDEQKHIDELTQQQTEAAQTPMQLLLEAVQQVLAIGGSVPCPNCGVRGEKDDGCMHISCQACGCRWCYCCGKQRGIGERHCSTCDRQYLFLQTKAGWGNFRRGNETNGYGALHEFHRRRMCYFLRQLKAGVPRQLWQDLQAEHPGALEDVPTVGRRIDWDAIDLSSPPLFGDTREDDLLWLDEAAPIIAQLQARLPLETRGEAPQQRMYSEAAAIERSELVEDILLSGAADTDELINQILQDELHPNQQQRSRRFRRSRRRRQSKA